MKKKKPVARISEDKVLEFIRAAEAGNVRLVRALLKAGMNVNAAYQGGTKGSSNALINAVRSGRTAVVDLLLKHGAVPSARALTIQRLGTQFPIDALALASEKGYLEIVRLLIKAGANVNESMVYDLDSLNAAVVEGHLAVVCELIDAGYLVSSPGGQKALDAAIARKRQKIALCLIAAGVDVQNDTEGLLLSSAVKGLVRVVKAMLDAGANPKGKLFTGKTTLQSFRMLRRRKEDWEYGDGDNRNEKVADAIQQLLENTAKKNKLPTPLSRGIRVAQAYVRHFDTDRSLTSPMIPREILKKIRQIELRTNRLVNESTERGCVQSTSRSTSDISNTFANRRVLRLGLRPQPRSVSVSRRSQPIVSGRFGNCGEFAIIKNQVNEALRVLIPSNSTGLKTRAAIISPN